MPLIECPDCGHKVLSVASTCPHCGFSLTAHRKRGQTPCRKCGYEISAKQADCPHCGSTSPRSRYPGWVGPVLVAGAVAVLAVGALWTQIDRFVISVSSGTDADSALVGISGDVLARDAPPAVAPPIPARRPALQQPGLSRVTQVRWASTWLNVRQERSGGSPVVATIQPGQRLQVDSLESGWWAFYVEGRVIGYVADYLLLEEPLPPQ